MLLFVDCKCNMFMNMITFSVWICHKVCVFTYSRRIHINVMSMWKFITGYNSLNHNYNFSLMAIFNHLYSAEKFILILMVINGRCYCFFLGMGP